jgi:integrase
MSISRDKARGCFVFEFDRRIDGRRVRLRKALPKTWSQAQADAFDRKESAKLYAAATGIERPRFTIDQAVEKYIEHRTPNLKAGAITERELAIMMWAYAGKPLDQLAEVCAAYARDATREDGKPLSPATVRNRIRYLTSACRYAWKHHAMGEHDPAERVVSPTVRNERHYFIDRRQMLELCRATQHRPTRAAIRIAFYSGMRMAEIRCATRRDGMFELPDTKNGKRRHVPIHPKIASAAKVPLPDQSWISTHFRTARKKLGMDWLHFHDLRHSAASQMINQGVDLYTVGAVLGHKSSVSTQRYSHLATDSLRDAVAKIGRKAA